MPAKPIRSRAAVPALSLLTSALVCLPARAEEHTAPPAPVESPRRWTLGPRLGLGFSQTRDEVLSPLTYRGVQLVVGAAFQHERGPNRHQARLEVAPGYKVDRFRYRGIFITQRLDYRYLRLLVGDDHSSFRFALGPGAGMELDPALYADASTDYPYWQTIYDLRLAARFEHRLSARTGLELDAGLSVLGTGSRPPAERFDVGEFRPRNIYTESHTDFRFLSFHNHVSLELRPCFRHRGRGPGSQAVCYELGVRWLKDPLPIITLDSRLDYTFFF